MYNRFKNNECVKQARNTGPQYCGSKYQSLDVINFLEKKNLLHTHTHTQLKVVIFILLKHLSKEINLTFFFNAFLFSFS